MLFSAVGNRTMKNKQHAVYERLDAPPPIFGSPHYLEECTIWQIPGSAWSIQGHSIAGERTGFMIPELRLFLDGGMSSCKVPSHILVSHSHTDHTQGLPSIAMGGMDGRNDEEGGALATRPPVYMPSAAVEPLKLLARAHYALNSCSAVQDVKEEMNVRGVAPGEHMQLACGKKGSAQVRVDVLECCHTVPCVGYLLSSITRKLLPHLEGLPKEDIGQRKRQGEEVTSEVVTPVLAFLGDTTPSVFEEDRNPLLQNAPVVMVECTGFVNGTEEKMSSRGHSHWTTLQPVIASRPGTMFVLIHLSRSVKEADAVDVLLSSGLRNVVLWLDSGVVEIASILAGADSDEAAVP